MLVIFIVQLIQHNIKNLIFCIYQFCSYQVFMALCITLRCWNKEIHVINMFQAYLGFRPRIFFVCLRPIVIVGHVSPRSVLCQSRWSGMIYWRANRMPTFELFDDHLAANSAKYPVVWNNVTPSCWFFISS